MLKSLWPLQLLARSLGVAAATAVLLLMLASCATLVKGSTDDGAPLKANQGLLVLQVESNADLSLAINDYAGEVSNSTIIAENLKGSKTVLRIPRGRSRWVVPMDAGDYSWSRVVSGATLAVLRPASLFRVAVGKLCYAGSLTLTSTGDKVYVSVRDEEADARAFVRDDYRRYSGAMPFTKFVTEFRADSAIRPRDCLSGPASKPNSNGIIETRLMKNMPRHLLLLVIAVALVGCVNVAQMSQEVLSAPTAIKEQLNRPGSLGGSNS